jgi:hypothetical protein
VDPNHTALKINNFKQLFFLIWSPRAGFPVQVLTPNRTARGSGLYPSTPGAFAFQARQHATPSFCYPIKISKQNLEFKAIQITHLSEQNL